MRSDQLSSLKSVGATKIYDYDPDLSSNPIPPHLHAIPEQPESKIDGYLMRFESLLNMLFRSLMILTCLLLACLMFTQTVMRYGMDSSFSGFEEASVLLAVWVYFLGMGYATREGEHIRGGIVSLVVKDQQKVAYIRFIGSTVCMIAACIFGYFAYTYAINEISKGRVSTSLRWPRGIWSASMIVGFAMMIGYFLLETINEFRGLRKTARQRKQSVSTEQHNPTINLIAGRVKR